MSEVAGPPPNRRVAAVAYDGLCAFEFGVAAELFGLPRPELDVDWYTFDVVTVDPPPLRMLGGVEVRASPSLALLRNAGTIVLPGWRTPAEPPPQPVLTAICDAHTRGARVVSICSGVFALAATGLLDGKAATTHWRHADELARRYPSIEVRPDVLFVDNGSLLTSAGSAAGIDLGLHLIRRDHGAAVANAVAKRLVVPPQRDGGQAQFIAAPPPRVDESPLADVMTWALAHLDRPLTVADLARRAHMADRTFARRFAAEIGTTPHRWLVRQRVRRAQELLETTAAPIDRVAAHCGFNSAATLRHHFGRQTRTTPTAYRKAFRRA